MWRQWFLFLSKKYSTQASLQAKTISDMKTSLAFMSSCCSHDGCYHYPQVPFQRVWLQRVSVGAPIRLPKYKIDIESHPAPPVLQNTIELSSAHAPHHHHPPTTRETKLPQDISEAAIKQPRGKTFRDECHWLPPSFLSVLSYRSSQLLFPCLAQYVT